MEKICVDGSRALGRSEGERLARALTKEFLRVPDFDVALFETDRVRALFAELQEMLIRGISLDAIEAYREACTEIFAKSLREKIATARAASLGRE